MTDLQRKIVMFCDLGGDYTHLAEAVVNDFAEVLYWTPSDASFRRARNLLPGIGLAGVERIDDLFDNVDRCDLLVFPDVGEAGLQTHFRSRGMPVFGSGDADRLERDRGFLKKVCAQLDIQTAAGVGIQGVAALRKMLQSDGSLWVKLSWFRGDGETFEYQGPVISRDILNEIEMKLGPYGSLAEFVVESPIADDDGPCVEIGLDKFCADGNFPSAGLWGYEGKDKVFVGSTARLPDRLRRTQERLRPALKALGYRGALSTETRETNDASYFLDFTGRFGSPPSELQSKMITNLAKILWGYANGEVVEPDFRARYGVQLVMRSSTYEERPIAITIDRPDRTAIHGHCNIDGVDWAVSMNEIAEMGAAIGLGNTMEDAHDEAIEVAESIKGTGVEFDAGALTKALETISEGEKLDIRWSDFSGEGSYAAEET